MKSLYASFFAAVVFAGASTATTISYTGVNNEQQYSITQAGVYQITVYGAQGGNADAFTSRPGHITTIQAGGLGAVIGGDISLTSGEVLDLYIGQQGGSAAINGGGGGGTFIALDSSGAPGTLLLVGGGGGGANSITAGGNATISNSGSNGGQAGLYAGSGGGGGGYLTNGSAANIPFTPTGQGGNHFSNLAGGTGFAIGYGNANGGYGGGGGAGDVAGGGGGGYSGGNGGGQYVPAGPLLAGSGGGSYVDPDFTTLVESVSNTGNGYVVISLLEPAASPVPEPSALALIGFGLLTMGVVRRKLNRSI